MVLFFSDPEIEGAVAKWSRLYGRQKTIMGRRTGPSQITQDCLRLELLF